MVKNMEYSEQGEESIEKSPIDPDALSAVVIDGKISNKETCNGSQETKGPKFPDEKQKTLMAFLILCLGTISNSMSIALVHERMPDRQKSEPLSDIVLDRISGYHPTGLDASEIIIMVSTNITLLIVILHKHRFIIFRRVFLILSLLYFMRTITIFVTVLPMSNSKAYCSPKAPNAINFTLLASRVVKLMSGFGLAINGKYAYCGDYIYSGHTVILVICYLVIREYTPSKMVWLHWMYFVTSSAGVLLLLYSKSHYTIDVIIAYFATTRTFWIYHTLANFEMLKRQSASNHLSRMWWYRAFQYFEGNAVGVLPNRYDWPFSVSEWFHCENRGR